MKKEFKGFIAGAAVTAVIFSVSIALFGNKKVYVPQTDGVYTDKNETVGEENSSEAGEVSEHGAVWSYSGASGPEYWGELNEEYSLAKTGMEQSPINLKKEIAVQEQSGSGLEIHYAECAFEVENNGHTIEGVPSEQENYITLDGVDYYLAQFHFHAPSEHQIDGVNSEMEVHFVHKSQDGNIAVLGVLIEEGDENQELKELLDTMPAEITSEEEMVELAGKINILKLLPEDKSIFRYNGSLTTPPCTEGVKWIVYQNPILFSKDQLDAYKAIYSGTNRLIQPLNEREITLY